MIGLAREDFPMAIEGDGVEFRMRELGEMAMAWVRLPEGANLTPLLQGLPEDLCQCPHWGFMLRGKLVMHTRSGDEVYEAGQAFYWAPGHAPEALEDCEYIDVSPAAELKHVVDHVTKQAAAG
ncbi:MAG: hypothetical protein WD015_05715 [Gaiellaceae bacterium]